jgi:tight adherence protein B
MTPVTIIALLAALAVGLAAYAVWSWAFGLAERRDLRQRLATSRTAASEAGPNDILRSRTLSTIPSINAFLRQVSLTAQLERLITQAGMRTSVASMLYLQVTLAVATASLLEWWYPASYLTELFFALVVGAMPIAYVLRRRKQHFQAFAEQFPGALDMIKSSLGAGHSLNYALEVATEELPDPIAAELKIVLEEIRLGLSPRDALENLTRRVPIGELRFFALAVVLTREVGGNLSEVLGTLATTLRERTKLRQQIRALSGQGRASATLLIALPPSVGFFANVISPGFLTPLYATSLGRNCVMVALALQVIGLLMVKRICNPRELRIA